MRYTSLHYEKIFEESSDIDDFIEKVKHYHDELLKRRAPLHQKSGFTLPGYNFCGPGNSLDFLPTSALDAFCQFHDMVY